MNLLWSVLKMDSITEKLPKLLYSFSALAGTVLIFQCFLSISIYKFIKEYKIDSIKQQQLF